MPTRDGIHRLAAATLLAPASSAVTATSNVADNQGFESMSFVVDIGAITGGDATNFILPKLQESDTTVGANFTDVALSDYLGAFVNAVGSTSQLVGYRGVKRYTRVVLTRVAPGGGAPVTGFLAGVTALYGRADIWPPVAPTPIVAS